MRLALGWSVVLLTACGGGSDQEPPAPPALRVQLTPAGTLVSCTAGQSSTLLLTRTVDEVATSAFIACPGEQWLVGDQRLSRWTLSPRPESGTDVTAWSAWVSSHTVAETTTQLPAPWLLRAGGELRLLSRGPSLTDQLAGAGGLLRLEGVGPDGNVVAVIDTPAGRMPLPQLVSPDTRWRWTYTAGAAVWQSPAQPEFRLERRELGFWGALAVGAVGGRDGVVGEAGPDGEPGYGPPGLGALMEGRVFRDLRIADLDQDGVPDVVSNVYGDGCTMIGYGRRSGGFDFEMPTRQDGSCIGGNGETLLVADFDGDGRVDVVLPSYQRFDFLRNLGGRRFIEEAAVRGIDYPNYLPKVEGAAAVDIDLDGDVDIVVASEVLLNDGMANFTPMAEPFGPGGQFDEGMSVADLDADGAFDIVKLHPSRGPKFYWGRLDGGRYALDAGNWLYGGDPVMNSSYGLAVGHLSGGPLPEMVYAGGNPAGTPPRLCLRPEPRRFDCREDLVAPTAEAFNDLLLISDTDGDGVASLVARYDTVKVHSPSLRPQHAFRIDLRDAEGRSNRFGHVVRAFCALDDSVIGMRFVDGGNGFMAQGDYPVSFTSDWCPRIHVELMTPSGPQRHGPFDAGLTTLRTPA